VGAVHDRLRPVGRSLFHNRDSALVRVQLQPVAEERTVARLEAPGILSFPGECCEDTAIPVLR
jgi:hypothetical protein